MDDWRIEQVGEDEFLVTSPCGNVSAGVSRAVLMKLGSVSLGMAWHGVLSGDVLGVVLAAPYPVNCELECSGKPAKRRAG